MEGTRENKGGRWTRSERTGSGMRESSGQRVGKK